MINAALQRMLSENFKLKRIILLLLLIVLGANQLVAQKFTVQNYTDENGLPQNSVKSIATDNAGFVWLATENGL